MENLGHKSQAVHHAYASKAQVKLPALEDFERRQSKDKVVQVKFGSAEYISSQDISPLQPRSEQLK